MDGWVIWFLPSTGKWYVGDIDEDNCAGRDFIDCRAWETKEYDSLKEAVEDERLVSLAESNRGEKLSHTCGPAYRKKGLAR